METIDLKSNSLWARRLRFVLDSEGITTWEELAEASPAMLLTYKHIGSITLDRIHQELTARGLTFGKMFRLAASVPPIDPPQPGVYFLRCPPFVKIGYSTDVPARIEGIRFVVPFETTLAHVIDCEASDAPALERQLHRQYANHLHRNEWFREEGELRVFLESVSSAGVHGQRSS